MIALLLKYLRRRTRDVHKYRRLLRDWISWAVRHEIPLGNLGYLPKARQYLWQSRMKGITQPTDKDVLMRDIFIVRTGQL